MRDNNRFQNFTDAEKNVLRNGLLEEADLDPEEDPSFPPIIEIAESLLVEIEETEE